MVMFAHVARKKANAFVAGAAVELPVNTMAEARALLSLPPAAVPGPGVSVHDMGAYNLWVSFSRLDGSYD